MSGKGEGKRPRAKSLRAAIAHGPLEPLYDSHARDPISYPMSAAQKSAMSLIQKEIEREIAGFAAGTKPNRVSLDYRTDERWLSPVEDMRLNVSALRAVKIQLKKAAAHSISQVLLATVPIGEDELRWIAQPVVVTLAVDVGEAGSVAAPNTLLSPVGCPAALSVADPTPEQVHMLVAEFMRAASAYRAEALRYARDQLALKKPRDWLQQRIVLHAAASLLPINKAFFGCGVGAQIVKRSLVAVNAMSAAAKKPPNSLSRTEVQDLWWRDKLANPADRHNPPLVLL